MKRSSNLVIAGLIFALQQVPAGSAVEIPRFDDNIVVDGVLAEDVWSRAAVISGFSQYEPADGRAAVERTEVRVWYAPDAIHFGIIAYDSEPQLIRATRADRDNISGDDHVVIFLDTFRDRRRAFFFGVNPLGVQLDGVRTEGSASAGRTFGGSTDTSPDFLFESAGRVTADGYVVEVRIPFKSLRYPSQDVQEWGINIERRTHRTGFVDTWPATRRGSASFLAQGGVLTGLHDLRRGMVFEAQPFVTMNAPGVRTEQGFERGDADADVGVNLRFGFTSNSLDATINPDFSQVEADAGQVTVNERFALFVEEKRPFFLEGIELFATPNQLVYTRRVVEPRGGAKVTGKTGPLSYAYLTALDRGEGDRSDALFNIARLRGDIGTSSLLGLTVTDRSETGSGERSNRVVSGDARIVFGGLYYVEGQLGGAWTNTGSVNLSDPIWKAEFDRTGRSWGFNYNLTGVGDEFITDAGFVNRTGVVTGRAMNRLTWFGPDDGTLERITVFFGPNRVWRHSEFGRRGGIEGSEFVNSSFRFRGDWEVGLRGARQFAEIDSLAFALHRTPVEGALVPYRGLPRVSGPNVELSASTPTFQSFDARASVAAGRVALYAEGSEGDARTVNASLSLRPAASVRIGVGGTYVRLLRARDGSEFARTLLPRVRAEYQPTRSFFLRAITEYRAERRAALRDARTGELLVVNNVESSPFDANTVRLDLLASYQPTPGTVAFFGYGSAMAEPDAFGFRDLRRSADGFFIKLAYQFRR